MGPHTENQKIEQLHRHTLEQDIESVSQDAQPSYHDNYRAPRGLAVLQSIEANGGRVVVCNVDYQITKVELKPVGIKAVEKPVQKKGSQSAHSHSQEADFQTQMKLIKDRRVRRKVPPTFLEGGMRNEDYHGAFHNYVSESTECEYDPVMMSPKLQDSGVKILTIDGVDYVLKSCLEDGDTYGTIEEHLNVPPEANVDLWPEEVVLYDADAAGGSNTYVRADVVYWEAGAEKPTDHRLEPKSG